jgi:hypothetical protein
MTPAGILLVVAALVLLLAGLAVLQLEVEAP